MGLIIPHHFPYDIGTVEKFDLSQEFIGIILLPIIGNAAEHYTAITVAMRNKMDLALGAVFFFRPRFFSW